MEGHIKLYRKILDHPVFAHQTALKIWIWCLAKASYKIRCLPIKIGKGSTIVTLNPGQFIFGRFKAEEQLGIDGSTIYKWIQKFASDDWGLISIESNNQYSIVTVCNWDNYQGYEDEIEQPRSNHITTVEQLCNNHVTTVEHIQESNKKVKKVNKVKEVFVPPLVEDVIKYFVEKGYKIDAAKKAHEYYSVNDWIDSQGNKVHNWKQKMIAVWFKLENKVEKQGQIR
jgi:hypothetical protein